MRTQGRHSSTFSAGVTRVSWRCFSPRRIRAGKASLRMRLSVPKCRFEKWPTVSCVIPVTLSIAIKPACLPRFSHPMKTGVFPQWQVCWVKHCSGCDRSLVTTGTTLLCLSTRNEIGLIVSTLRTNKSIAPSLFKKIVYARFFCPKSCLPFQKYDLFFLRRPSFFSLFPAGYPFRWNR